MCERGGSACSPTGLMPLILTASCLAGLPSYRHMLLTCSRQAVLLFAHASTFHMSCNNMTSNLRCCKAYQLLLAVAYPRVDLTAAACACGVHPGNGGADYKRGKRFRKLMKLMESSQTQQVRVVLRQWRLGRRYLVVSCHIGMVSMKRRDEGWSDLTMRALACASLACFTCVLRD